MIQTVNDITTVFVAFTSKCQSVSHVAAEVTAPCRECWASSADSCSVVGKLAAGCGQVCAAGWVVDCVD